MKKTILFFAIMAFAYGANAQANVSIAASIGAPTMSGASLAYGVDLQGDFPVGDVLSLTASAGYQGYSWKGGLGSTGFIPLLGGAKFTFGESMVYGHAQLGYGISTQSGGGGAFTYAPSIGYYFSRNFDGSIKYLAQSKNGYNSGSVNIRLAYNF